MIRIAITGASGQVGSELQECAWPSGFVVKAFDHSDLDIANPAEVLNRLAPPLNVVINLAAYTAVDRAETDLDEAWKANAEGLAVLAEHCAVHKMPLLHLSTDYVFAGLASRPYVEEDEVGPLNAYGESKLAGEMAIRRRLREHLVIRTSSVFGATGTNFVRSMLRLAAERSVLKVVDDQIACPTSARDIAEMIVILLTRMRESRATMPWGTYHYCGRPAVSWFGLARKIFDIAADCGMRPPTLLPIPAAQFPSAARRPAYSAMNCHKISQNFGIGSPYWMGPLADVVRALISEGITHVQ